MSYELHKGCVVILRKLFSRRNIGGSHTPEERVLGWVKNLQQGEQEGFKKCYHELLQQEWIIRQKKTGEWHVSINPRKLPEVLNEIE